MKENEQEFSLERAMDSIRKVVEEMKQGGADFDRQLALFSEGMDLIKESRVFLDKAELRVQQLLDGELKDFSEEEGLSSE